jgi:hypothetical protein
MDENTDIGTPKRAASRLAHSAATLGSKELGDLGELAFVLAATAKGLPVAKPFGDCRRYDLIVDSGRRLLRIQVKSVFRRSKRGNYEVHASRQRLSTRLPYTALDIDFVAAYIAPKDIWYLVPVSVILTRTCICLYPDGSRKKKDKGTARYEKYKEAWHLLDERRKASAATSGML